MTDAKPYASIAAIGDRIGGLINSHIDLTMRRIIAHRPNVLFDPKFIRLETGEAHPYGNFACMRDPPDEAGTRAAIEPLIRRNAPAAVLLLGPVSHPIEQQLTRAGFAFVRGLPTMAVDIDDKPARTNLPAGYTFARVTSIADRERWADVFSRGYGLPLAVGAAFTGGIDGDASADAPTQYFWILKGDTPVCTSLVFLVNGVAGIYCVATLPEERKKGLGAHATEQPLRIARKLGYHVGVLQSSVDGQPIYRRLGFSEFGEVPVFVRMPQ